MTSTRSSAGDPAATLRLLWRHRSGGAEDGPRRRGPRPGLDVDTVVAAALALVDEAGVEALTMRLVARRLGVPTMSLYTYVPGRAELVDCLVDDRYLVAFGDLAPVGPPGPPPSPGPPVPSGGWRAAVAAHARRQWSLHLAHPWLADVATTRPVLGPGATAAYEHGLAAFEGAGLPDVERDAALTLLLGFVRSCARLHADGLRAADDSGTSDRDWWQQVSPGLREAMGPASFPLAARVGAAAGEAHGGAYDAGHAFEWGLPRILDGLAARTRPTSASESLYPGPTLA